MANSLNTPKVVRLNNEEIMEALKEAVVKKRPELKDEEFEPEISYDSYSRLISCQIHHI